MTINKPTAKSQPGTTGRDRTALWGALFVPLAAITCLFASASLALSADNPLPPIESSRSGTPMEPLRLSLAETFKLAIEGNRNIQISSFSPTIAAEELKAVLAIYDPVLFEENSIIRTNRPVQSLLDNGTTVDGDFLEHKWNAKAGVRKPLSSGGSVSLFADVDHLNSSSEFVDPNPQYTSRLTVELRQSLLREFGDRSNHAAIEIANRKVAISTAEHTKILADVLKEVGISYWNVVYYRQQLDVRQQAAAAAESVYQRELIRKEKGISDLLNVDRALSEAQSRKREAISNNTDLLLAMDRMKLLMGMPPDSPYFDITIEPTEPLECPTVEPDRQATIDHALQQRPELVIAKKKVNITEIKKSLARHQKLPKLEVWGSLSLNSLDSEFGGAFEDTYSDDYPSWEIGLGFEWPLGSRKAAAQYNKSLQEGRQAAAEYNKAMAQIIFEINSAYRELVQTRKEIETAEQVRNARRRVLEREEARFELAKISNQDLLKSQNLFYEAERNHLRAIIAYHISLLKLEWAQGSLPASLNLSLPEPQEDIQ